MTRNRWPVALALLLLVGLSSAEADDVRGAIPEWPPEAKTDFWWWLRYWSTVPFADAAARPLTVDADDWAECLWPAPRLAQDAFTNGDDIPATEEPADSVVRQHRQTTQIFGVHLTSQVTVNPDRQGWERPPLPSQPWRTEESLQMPVLGPFFAFGQVGAAPDANPSRELRVSSRGGLGCKMEVVPGAELQFRGGPVMTFHERLGGEEAQWLVEVQAKYALPLNLGLEYQGAAMPALNPAAHDRVTQDVRLAVPLSDYGQFRVGARHQWENAPTYQPWGEGMQLYLGVELKRGGP